MNYPLVQLQSKKRKDTRKRGKVYTLGFSRPTSEATILFMAFWPHCLQKKMSKLGCVVCLCMSQAYMHQLRRAHYGFFFKAALVHKCLFNNKPFSLHRTVFLQKEQPIFSIASGITWKQRKGTLRLSRPHMYTSHIYLLYILLFSHHLLGGSIQEVPTYSGNLQNECPI